MREYPGKRRRRNGQRALPDAALTFASQWQWPVVPGAGLEPRRPGRRDRTRESQESQHSQESQGSLQPAARPHDRECTCPYAECAAPGAHPYDPGVLAATTDPRMVRWWWEQRPDAPVLLATGGRAPSAVSLPAVTAARALTRLDRLGVRTGPVVATPERWALLVASYGYDELGELLGEHGWVPASLGFHGEGGYLALPPSQTGAGRVRWERAPRPDGGAPWLPPVASVVDVLVAAVVAAPGEGSRFVG
ncbi:bifunctional DNA primase/polymerase [Streptomyces sp. WMMC500]|uniref:bifunctional DNA primase/polymerase n=1 Tax=Streptomyces sp. WMMC500 TaxID=3015154 RepID=UPI00248AEDCD|nr:bifunctional DNA primase/polymerase [Streptomyces sp. WMMC500]WBB58028.1 bifunctional DNA primase/polymerase [Streptomyces sp. WMMC500]